MLAKSDSRLYVAHDLLIRSYRSLPGLRQVRAADEDSDVVVRSGQVAAPDDKKEGSILTVASKGQVVTLHWKDIASIEVRSGREIVVDPLPKASRELVGFLIVGAALGVALHQRQFVTLHASAVALGEGVVAFVGAKGMGKSTTAAAFLAKDYPMVTDDVLAIHSKDGAVSVAPGERFSKLWPNSVAAALENDPDDLPPVHGQTTKRFQVLPDGPRGPLPLKGIYVLDYEADRHDVPRVETLPSTQAYLQLTANSYALQYLGNEGASSWHARAMGRLVRLVPVKRLVRVPDISTLSDIVTCVERDLLD